jgi:hypothetical protein
MAAAGDEKFDDGIHGLPAQAVGNAGNGIDRQIELESGRNGVELADIERVEMVYRYVVSYAIKMNEIKRIRMSSYVVGLFNIIISNTTLYDQED